MIVGQNVVGGQLNWMVVIQVWWDEIYLWKYGLELDIYLGYNGWFKVGYFIQVYNSNNKLYIGIIILVNYRQVYNRNFKLYIGI